jgi:CarD family transcriptional regulator
MPNVEPAVVEVERQRENYYRTYMDKAVCSSWVALIKYLYKRNNERIAAGKKIISLDERYMRMAQNCLHGELAAALEVPREQVDSIIQQILDDGE